jgi:uncharacterized membrane protein YdbT with pleckstrin-like domain
MDQKPANDPSLPGEAYHKLGRKTLMIFVMQRINASFILLLVAIGLSILKSQEFLARVPIPHFDYYVDLASRGCFALFGIFFIFSFFGAWLTYATYQFALTEDSLKIKRGILNKEEIAIPYRQIQDVDVERDLGFQMMGLSRIVVLTAGHEEDPKTGEAGEAEGVLPAIDKDLARWLQEELLKRANVQKVTTANQT